jgi:D-glycero-D-manno-heptose 1,7-bisphosphate phosphatase
MRRAVFLDRDGVLNEAFVVNGVPVPPKNLSEVKFLRGVREAIELLNENNFIVVVVTNQPDVARGTVTRESVEFIHSYLGHELGIEHFFTCFHDDPQGCDCRKPKPGLLQNAARELDLDLQNSYLVGDRWRDIAAGQAAGCLCFFIEYEYEEKSPLLPFTKVSSLAEAVDFILENPDDNFS